MNYNLNLYLWFLLFYFIIVIWGCFTIINISFRYKIMYKLQLDKNTWNHANMCNQMIKMATLVVDDPKAPFSIANTPRYRGGRYSIPWIASLYPWSFTL